MSWLETFRTGIEAVRSHRLRSLLTMMGIFIGIAAVILTVGLGQGAQQQVRSQISALGSNLLVISPGSTTNAGGVRGGFGSASTLTMADAEALKSKTVAPDIARVAPTSQTGGTLLAGSTNWTAQVIGTTPDWQPVRARTLSAGRFLSDADIEAAANVVVLGPDTTTELFAGRSAVGETVTINGTPMTVVGVLNPAGSSTTNQDDLAVVPSTTLAVRLSTATNRNAVSNIYVEAVSSRALSSAYQEAQSEISALHRLTAATADFSIASQQSLLATATKADRTLTVLLGGIAGIALLVGGIGVMNIMLVSVTERIREIGLRKALGATPRDIRRQFLLEASVLGLTGGLLGVSVAIAGARSLPHLINQPVLISPAACLLAITVALGIGIGFGVYPATRAARLAPIDALRSE
ncbi:MAG: ABC transporter permease [Actinomycetota bacterium]